MSREVQVPAHELEAWRRTFLEAGAEGLKKRHGDAEPRLLKQAQAKVGELAMRLEPAEMLLEKRGYAEELARLQKSRGFWARPRDDGMRGAGLCGVVSGALDGVRAAGGGDSAQKRRAYLP
ncbi:MAG: hypothetical protein ACREN5_10695 [Gemmatimonadales bacterium]